MGDLLRTIIRWVIVILIIILIIFLLFKITNKSSKTKKSLDSGVETLENVTSNGSSDKKTNNYELNPEDDTDSTTKTDNTQPDPNNVEVPDTATSTTTTGLIGVIVLASGVYYIYRRRKLS